MADTPWSLFNEKTIGVDADEIALLDSEDGIDTNKRMPFSNFAQFNAEYGFHTGWMSGLLLSVNADPTKFDITTGSGIIVNRDPDPLNTVVTKIPFSATLAITDLFLGDTFTYVFLDNVGALVQRVTPPSTLDDLNNLIFIGQLRHFGGNIVTVDNNTIAAYGSTSSHMAELVFNGGLRLSGAKISPNGANLQVNISAGILEQFGRGRTVNVNNPNEYPSSAQVPIPSMTFFKAYVDGSGELIVDNSNNLLDPLMFNEGGLGTLEEVSPAGHYTIVHVREAAQTEAIIFYYGTQKYQTLSDALVAVESTFEEHPDTIQISPIADIFMPGNMSDFAASVANGTAVIKPITRRI